MLSSASSAEQAARNNIRWLLFFPSSSWHRTACNPLGPLSSHMRKLLNIAFGRYSTNADPGSLIRAAHTFRLRSCAVCFISSFFLVLTFFQFSLLFVTCRRFFSLSRSFSSPVAPSSFYKNKLCAPRARQSGRVVSRGRFTLPHSSSELLRLILLKEKNKTKNNFSSKIQSVFLSVWFATITRFCFPPNLSWPSLKKKKRDKRQTTLETPYFSQIKEPGKI